MTKRLCLLVTSSVTATTFLKGYLEFLQDDGWEVTLVCSDGPGLDELVSQAGVKFEPIALRREPSLLHDLSAVVAAVQLFRRIRPDSVVYATPKASLIGALASRIVGVPRRIYELWGLRLETAQGLSRVVFSFLEWLTARLSTAVIANSKSLASRAQELGVNGGKEVIVLGAGSSHGVDAERFSRTAQIPQLDDALRRQIEAKGLPVIGFVGRLNPDKGIDVLAKAVKKCADEGVRLQLLIVGEAEGVDIESLLGGLDDRVSVHVVGFVLDTRPLLAVMDLLVLPSRREGFPNVVLEAASMQVPSVVSDATGCVDSVVHGETGVIVPTDDARALAAALTALVEDPVESDRMGRAARQRVLEEFAPETVWAAHSARWKQ
ncbi:glycosyltransferase family 4 protein [Microbacterium sp. NPDC077644]|uniref:glycosyltransferase family 4 protein n=1 Tax=Microbacterium sp. NPDC077644 TaxID=3155055 RepID=UPI00344CACAE